jgi:serine/threonine protein kinase
MLTGRFPFAGDYDQAIFFNILNEQPEPLTAIRSGVPMSLEWIVNKLLAKNSDERYQNANDLIIDLKAVDFKSNGFSRTGQTVVSSIQKSSDSKSKHDLKRDNIQNKTYQMDYSGSIVFGCSNPGSCNFLEFTP